MECNMTILAWIFAGIATFCAVGGIAANRAAYRNGFWDGVLWERERDGRIWPKDADPRYHLPGAESLYPSKPDPSWHGWASLAGGAQSRNQESNDSKL